MHYNLIGLQLKLAFKAEESIISWIESFVVYLKKPLETTKQIKKTSSERQLMWWESVYLC